MLTLAGCASAPVPSKDPHDVQATTPGKANCLSTSAADAAAAVAQTNQTRRSRGLAPLTVDARLMAAAQAHACDMAGRGLMSHRGSQTTGPMKRLKANGYNPRIVAENIGAGPYDQPRILSEWSKSAGHLENILIPETRNFGIGRALGSDGKTMFWAGVYAVPMPF